MKIIGAYCERDDAPALIGEKEPQNNPMITHGICPTHRRELQQEIDDLAIRATPHGASPHMAPGVTVEDRPDRALSQGTASGDQDIQT